MAQFVKQKENSMKNLQKGVTLIELVLYMAIFTVLMSGVLYSSMYLQGVMTYNAIEYKAKENIYKQLTLLQNHLNNAKEVAHDETGIYIISDFGSVEQTIHDEQILIKYNFFSQLAGHKQIIQFPYMKFKTISFRKSKNSDTLQSKSIIYVDIERVDMRGKIQKTTEHLYVTRVDF